MENVIDITRYGFAPPGARNALVGEIIVGQEGAWMPSAVSCGGCYYPAVVLVEVGSLLVVDYGVPWSCVDTALDAAVQLVKAIAD